MAYIKIFPIKVTDKKALDYITNPDKTDEKLLVSGFGCSPETADLEFAMTREQTKKNGMDKGDNLAFHLIQSFKPGETDAETAYRLGQQFANEVLKGKYEYVISTHVDKNHIHNHIIFNAASFVDHHKYVSNKRSYHKICRISNRICQENGLATSMPTGEKGKSYKENMEYHRGTSWKAKLRVAVDKAIWSSSNYEEFLKKMQLAGYEVRQGKHLSFRAPEQKNFTYMKSLGSYYSEENVRIRLTKNRSKVKVPKHLSREARLYINISTYVTTGNRGGFERWAKLNNLKEAARTFNYLSENNLLNYDDFQQHISDVENSIKAADQKFEEISAELGTQKLPDRLFSTICLEVSPIRFLYPVSGFSVSSSYHLDSPGFYHLTDFGNSWALFFLPVQTTGSHMHYLNFFADQPVYFFQNSLIHIRFFGICTFASITGHHCSQKCVRRISIKKVTAILKGLQASHSGTYIIGVKAGQCSNFNHTASLACSTKSFRILSYSPSPFRTVCTS